MKKLCYQTLKDQGFYFVNPLCVAVNPAANTKLGQSGDVSGSALAIVPNKANYEGKKISGILCEGKMMAGKDVMQAMVVGIGINVHSFEKPEEIAGIAASVEDFTDIQKPRQLLVARFLTYFYDLYMSDDSSMHAFYKSHSLVLDKVITVIRGDERYIGYAQDIDEQYRLVLRREDGTYESLSSGEISIRL